MEIFKWQINTFLTCLLVVFSQSSFENKIYVPPEEFPAYELYNKGVQLQSKGDFDGAIDQYKEALLIKPDLFQAFNNLGFIYSKVGENDLAWEMYIKAAEMASPPQEKADALNNLGNHVQVLAQKDFVGLQQSLQYFEGALSVNPTHVEATFNIGKVMEDLGNSQQALEFYQKTLDLHPYHPNAQMNTANIYMLRKDFQKALEYQEALLEHGVLSSGKRREILCNMGQVYRQLDQHKEALECFQRAKDLDPFSLSSDYYLLLASRTLCQWDELSQLESGTLRALDQQLSAGIDELHQQVLAITPYESTLVPHMSGAKTRRATEVHTASWNKVTRFPEKPLINWKALKAGKEKLTIGYLSFDFRDHPMGHLTQALVTSHSSDLFNVVAASYGPDDDSKYRKRFEEGVDDFVDLFQVGDWEAGNALYTLGIDILVDLMAHTKGARVGLSALKPASLVVNYLGYPGTMGSEFTDYAMVDIKSLPPETSQFFTERIVYLPHQYQVNDYNASIPYCAEQDGTCQRYLKESFGLDPISTTICNFNTLDKMEPYSWHLWMNILRRLPASKLVLLMPAPTIATEILPRLTKEAEAQGTSPSRIIFLERVPKDDHIARVSGCDLFVDSLVYGAHSTAADTLWAAVPLVTVQGWGGYEEPLGKMPARVAATLISSVGVGEELITYSAKEMEDLAVRLLSDKKLLGKIRKKIAMNSLRYPLFNNKLTTLKIERAYQAMWEIKTSGHSVQNIMVNPDLPFQFGNFIMEEDVLQLSVSCLQKQEMDCAKAAALRCIASFSNNAECWHFAGLSFFQDSSLGADRFPKSVEYLETATKLMPGNVVFHTNLGHVLHAFNDFLGAKNAFYNSIRLEPVDVSAALALQRTLLALQDFLGEYEFWNDFGLNIANNMDVPSSSRVELLTNHAMALSDISGRNPDDSTAFLIVELLQSAVELEPHNSQLLLKYGAALRGVKKFSEALEAMLSSVRAMNQHDFLEFGRSVPKITRPPNQRVVAIYCYEYGQTWWPNWGPSSMLSGGLGGSEEAVVFISRELVKLGYHVEVYNEVLKAEWGQDEHGVHWYPYQSYDVNTPADFFVGWRYHVSMALSYNSRGRFLWLQDKPPYDTYLPEFTDKLHGIFCLSGYHISTLPLHARPKGIVTPNGIDPTFLADGENLPNVFVYGSAPDRGLQTVLQTWPEIQQQVPNATLEVYYGFSGSFLKHIQTSMPNHKEWVNYMKRLLNQEGVIYKGMVDHATLSNAYANAGFILYPTVFPETGCVTLMKAQSMGAIPITSKFKDSTLPELTQGYDLGPRPLRVGYEEDAEWQQLWIKRVVEVANQDLYERQKFSPLEQEEEKPTIQAHRKRMKKWARERFLWKHVAAIWSDSFLSVS